MTQLICPVCKKVFHNFKNDKCPGCDVSQPRIYDFENSDEYLRNAVAKVMDWRKRQV